MPGLVLPAFGDVDLSQVAGRGLMVAVVVMAETLLSENNFAFRNGYKIDDNQEIFGLCRRKYRGFPGRLLSGERKHLQDFHE